MQSRAVAVGYCYRVVLAIRLKTITWRRLRCTIWLEPQTPDGLT